MIIWAIYWLGKIINIPNIDNEKIKVSKSIKLDIIPGALKCLFSGNIKDK